MKENLLAARNREIAARDANPEGYETVEMSIDSAGATALMANLTNFYTNAPLAVLREYVSNAIDSHRRAKQSKPVHVTIPDLDARYADEVIVEDFGVGMSKAEIINVYSKFGASTKVSSGSEIGKFGLGAKSALAAATRFDIVATKDGVTTTAYVKKNFSGVGQFYFVSEIETGAPNGVKIVIPVTPLSAYTQDSLRWFFVGLSSQEIKLSGNPYITHISVHDPAEFEPLALAGNTAAWVSTRARSNTYNSQLHVNVGGVHYMVDISRLSGLLKAAGHEKAVTELLLIKEYARMVVLNAPIASLTLHPAREDFIYDEITVDALGALVENAALALNQHVQSQLNRLPDRLAAIDFTLTQRKASLPHSRELTYRGELVPTYVSMAGWYSIPTTLRSPSKKKETAFTIFQPNQVLPLTSIRRHEEEEFSVRGRRLRGGALAFEQQQAIRVTDVSLSDVSLVQKQLMKTYEELRFPERKLNANIWFTAPGVQLDSWASALITEELTFEELKQQVRDEQARRRAEAAAKGVLKRPKDDVKFAVVREKLILSRIVQGRDDYRIEFFSPEEIRAINSPVIISHKELPSTFAFTAPAASANQATISDWSESIALARYYRPDALIVLMPTQAKPSTLERRFPGYKLLNDVVLTEAQRIEDSSGRAHVINAARTKAMIETKYRLASVMTYSEALSLQQLDRIQHEDTRHWLGTLRREHQDAKLDPMDAHLLSQFGHMLERSAGQSQQLVENWRIQANRYPLLPLAVRDNQISKLVLDDFVLYLNAVDTVR